VTITIDIFLNQLIQFIQMTRQIYTTLQYVVRVLAII